MYVDDQLYLCSITISNSMQGTDTTLTLGYWGIRGRSEIIRVLLEYTGLKYTEKQYADHKEWFGEDKNKLGFDFPNLPYIIDGDTKITETNALITYVCLKADRPDLLGKTGRAKVQLAELKGVFADLMSDFLGLLFNKDGFAAAKDGVLKDKVFPRLDRLHKFLGDKDYFLGDLSVIDFGVYNFLKVFKDFDGETFKKYSKFQALYNRIEALPTVAAYLKSDRNKPRPFLPPTMVAWSTTF